jgi:nitrite reductase/ring-hydroxylating ferredoxin subunit
VVVAVVDTGVELDHPDFDPALLTEGYNAVTQSSDIPQLALKGTTLTCPKHEWAFDVRSGDCIKKGNSPLTRIESKVIKGRLLACW